jgi:hypothetical protein
MNRIEFTQKITMLLFEMIQEGEHPIIDYALRSQIEQHRLWQIGRDKDGNKIGQTVTNCDGYKIISGHQSGKAIDIYFIEDGKLAPPKKGFAYWHGEWTKMGGNQDISWDEDHWEA